MEKKILTREEKNVAVSIFDSIPSLCASTYFLIGAIMCGIYALNNPDYAIDERQPIKYCWAVPSQIPNFYISTDRDIGATADATNVTKNFATWFKWGFYLNLTMLLSICVCSVMTMIEVAANGAEHTADGLVVLYHLFCYLIFWGLAGGAWIITGLVLRFRTKG